MTTNPILCIQVDAELQLRLSELRYAKEIYALVLRNKEHLQRWMPWAEAEISLDGIREYLKSSLAQFANGEGCQWGIWYQGKLAGAIGYNNLNWANYKVEIGYWLDAALQGKGLVTKACSTLVTYAFDEYGLNKVEIHCGVANKRSRAIPERLGFTQEGIIRQTEKFRDHYADQVFYGMLASEWKVLHKGRSS